jgi:peptidyl-prolyl cis-trans isomerase D
MLQQIRDHLTGWVAVVIFAPLIIAFAFWGIENYQLGGRNFAAKVNGEEISLDEVQDAARNRLAMFQQIAPDGLTPEQEARIRADVIDGFVRREVLAQRARKQGYRVSTEALTKAISEIPQFQVDGNFDHGTYERMLALQGYTPASFEAAMRRDLSVQQLQNGLMRSSFATPQELNRRAELDGEQREMAYLLFPVSAHEGTAEITEEQVKARYEEQRESFVTPETVSLDYVELEAESLAGSIEVSEGEIREQYDAEVATGRFRTPDERRARHLLLKLEGADEAAVQAEAEALLTRARGGEDFATLAREHSQDEASAKDGGELGWVTQDMMVAPFSEALFSMKPGEISDIVRTQFGLHIIQLEEVRGGETKPYEEVHDELLAELRQRRADALYYDRAEQLSQRAFESRDSLAPVAQELGLQVQRVEGVTREKGEGIAAEAKVRAAAFEPNVLEDGENSDVIELGDGRAVVVRVVDRKPQAQRPLEEVRPEIEAQLRAEAAAQRAQSLASDALAKVREGGQLDTVALQFGGQYHAPTYVGRKSSPAELVRAVFAAPKPGGTPQSGQTALTNGDQVVYVVTAVRPGTATEATEDREALAREQVTARANADFAAYLGELEAQASVVIPAQPADSLDPLAQ